MKKQNTKVIPEHTSNEIVRNANCIFRNLFLCVISICSFTASAQRPVGNSGDRLSIPKICTGTAPVAFAGKDVSLRFGYGIGNDIGRRIGGGPSATGGSGSYTYIWQPASGLDNPTIANPIAKPTANTNYTLRVVDSKGCISTDGVTVTIGTSFTSGPRRGMYVNCFHDKMLNEWVTGNTVNAIKMLDYANAKGINYIALYGVDLEVSDNNYHTPYLDAFSDIVNEAHNRGIQVGVVLSTKSYIENSFTPSSNYNFQSFIQYVTATTPPPISISALTSLINTANPPVTSDLQTKIIAEATKAMLYTAYDYNQHHTGQVDVLSLEDEFWNGQSERNITDTTYPNHQKLLQSLTTVSNANKAIWPLLREDYIGWLSYRAQDAQGKEQFRAADIDSNIDRVLLASYTAVWDNPFGMQCNRLLKFGNNNTKANTIIWPLFDASSNQWEHTNCDGSSKNPPQYWEDYLGKYLTTNTTNINLGGPMSNVEHEFDRRYQTGLTGVCTNFSSTPKNNLRINVPAYNFNNTLITTAMPGFMWFTYSFMNDPAHVVSKGSANAISEISPEIKNIYPATGFNVYPNPAGNEVTVAVPRNIRSGIRENSVRVEVVDFTGKIVLNKKMIPQAGIFKLNTSALPTGTYLLKIEDGASTGFLQQKLIILH